jgi:hypothetical protein
MILDLSEAKRQELLDRHPIVEREYILPTPMMSRAYSVIRDRVWARRTGAVFFASPRTGKTRCALATKDLLLNEFPKIHVTLLSARSARPSDSHMFRLILEAEHHALSKRDANYLFESAVADITVKTKATGGHQFVLLLDEAQKLNDIDLQHLVSFHNALEQAKIKMTTISFAQPEIVHRRSALMASNDRQIIARFLSEPLQYDGCSSVIELRRILDSYDIGSEFPEGSGWSFTRFFVPIAFASGFRLGNYASHLWGKLASAAGIGSNGAVPMEHTCLTIENLLLMLKTQDCENLTVTDSDIAASVESSQLQSFCN